MSQLHVIARLTVHEGKLDEFRAIADECIRITREEDSGTLRYDWYFDEDETEFVVLEKYRDSDAVLEHVANVGTNLDDLLEISDLSLEVFGNPSAELIQATGDLDVTVYRHYGGA